MTDAELELAQKLAAHPKWKPMDGTLLVPMSGAKARRKRQQGDAPHARVPFWFVEESGRAFSRNDVGIPDLADPATQGCLVAMTREADCRVCVVHDTGGRDRFYLMVPQWAPGCLWEEAEPGPFATYGEALARALLAAWGES
jgi:hypothetical protein